MDCSTPGFPVPHHLPELAQAHVHWVGDAIQPSCPLLSLLLLPSIFPSIKVFSNELALPIRWPKYWRFSFSISPSNEYSGLTCKSHHWYFSNVTWSFFFFPLICNVFLLSANNIRYSFLTFCFIWDFSFRYTAKWLSCTHRCIDSPQNSTPNQAAT